MPPRRVSPLAAYVTFVVTAGAVALAVATFGFPGTVAFMPADFVFFTALALVTSAAPVHLPRGTIVSVNGAAILAAAFLGGLPAAAWVAALGSTEWRELRGRIPWYGTLFNHAALVVAAVGAASLFSVFTGGTAFDATPTTLGFAIVAGVTYIGLNTALVVPSLTLRSGASVRQVVSSDYAIIVVSMVALVPLAWLAAHVYVTVGWWAATLFILPLLTQRSTYSKVVEIRAMFTQTVKALSSAVDAKDKYTAGHREIVQLIARDIGEKMRCSEAELEALEWGGLLHDIGKIGIPDAVLMKVDKLTKEERTIMNSHPVKGEAIIRPVAKLAPELPLIRHHHEWYNGSGYPDHLAGEDIPKLARILHVADAFEAMTSPRPYRMSPLSVDQALGEIRKYTGIQFDPIAVDAFFKTKWVSRPRAPHPLGLSDPIPLLEQVAAMKARSASPSPRTAVAPAH
jgi:HD-GYP domain-containing protein (c-di-GMP phosphodiesterase class II)